MSISAPTPSLAMYRGARVTARTVSVGIHQRRTTIGEHFVMTEIGGDEGVEGSGGAPIERRCRWCRFPLAEHAGPGRPRQFCSQACRQWDWVSRQRARELALSDGELVMARAELDSLHDDLYVLECAVADTIKDLSDDMSAKEAIDALRWLLDAATPLANRRLRSA